MSRYWISKASRESPFVRTFLHFHFDSIFAHVFCCRGLGHCAVGMLIPARIVVISDVPPDLQHSEHAAHVDDAKWTFPTEHRNAVLWHGHPHHRHLPHATG